ncbi:hypothetical protein OFO07_05365 [Campylobacter sp. JMF_06 NA1]|uniref:DUF7674 family protein n=1 Tax=Campylobacter sp. JMF_06 NA1 TaxID=2983823 RepID=UPI0022E9CBF5|nr:hypothetical protein [Campylobacter sp. JMF_06 NA1]MDA3078349.1 hypothetical protein [Campylobacter sp. JMF_06 NA1]
MHLMETDLGKYEEYIYFFISKHKKYFSSYMEQIFPFDMQYIPSLLWILSSFANTTIKIFDELDELDKKKIFEFVESGVINIDDYISTAFCTGFIESIVNTSSKKEYEKIKPYFQSKSLEYANNWNSFKF